jgi:type II secretory pathway component PulC
VLARIKRVSETEVHVERSAIDDVLTNPARLLGSVRLDPGPRPGIGLRRVPAGSIPHALGLRSGDRLVGVNGLTLRGVEDAMTAYALMRKAPAWQFEISRHGRTRPLRIEIR